jgi:hypothetical protein
MIFGEIFSVSVILFILIPFYLNFDYYFLDEIAIPLIFVATFFAIYGHVLFILLYIIAKVFKKNKLQKYSIIGVCFSIFCLIIVSSLIAIKRFL